MDAVLQKGFRQEFELLVSKMIGPVPPNPGSEAFEDYMRTKAALVEAWGGGMLKSPDHLFYRCTGCFKIRTNRDLDQGSCVCGSMQVSNHVPFPMTTEQAEAIVKDNR